MSGGELALVDLYGLVSIVVEMYSMIAGRSASELIAGHLLPLPGTCLPPPENQYCGHLLTLPNQNTSTNPEANPCC